MLKSLLRSSVSPLVLVGILATFNPAIAGNSGLGGEQKPDETKNKIIPLKKESDPNHKQTAPSKTQLSSPPKRFDQKDSEAMGIFHGIPQDLSQLMFVLLAPEDTTNSELTCKIWYNLINDKKDFFLSKINNLNKEELETLSPQYLRPFLFHYDTFSLIHGKISSLYYGQIIEPMTTQSVQETNSPLSKSIENYESLLFQAGDLHPSFKRICFQYEPCKNFKHLMYAAVITGGSGALQNLFLKSLEEHPFEMKNLPQLMMSPDNLPHLHKHLIALRCLAIAKNEAAAMRMQAFIAILGNFYQENIVQDHCFSSQQKSVKKLIQKNSTYMSQPIWSTYAYGDIFPLLNNQLALICQIANTSYINQLNPEIVKNFFEYFGSLYPSKKTTLDSMAPSLLGEIYDAQGKNSDKFIILDELSERVDQDNLFKVLEVIVSPLILNGEYDKALQILEDAHKKVGDSPFRFQLLFQRALCILASQNPEHFQQAKEDIDAISTHFDILQTDEFDTPFALTIGENENRKTINEVGHRITKDQFLVLKGSLAIYEQRFDDAFQYLNAITSQDLLSCICYPSNSQKVILGALKSQLPHIQEVPKKLLKLFTKEINKNFSLNNFQLQPWHSLILNYGDVLHYLLKGYFKTHPLDQQNFNKLEKKILKSASQMVQPEQTNFERKKKDKK